MTEVICDNKKVPVPVFNTTYTTHPKLFSGVINMQKLSFVSLSFCLLIFLTNRSSALVGHSEDIYLLMQVDTETLKSWLPDRLELVDAHSSHHPLFINFGKQKGVGTVLPDYLEMSVKVPQVRFKRDPKATPHNYYQVLYMNNQQAVTWGIILYDSPKKFANMQMDDHSLSIENSLKPGSNIFEVSYRPGTSEALSPTHPNFQELEDWIGHPAITFKRGCYKCWGGTRKNVSLKPLIVDASIKEGFAPGLSPTSQHFEGLDYERLGAVQITSDWTFDGVKCPEK